MALLKTCYTIVERTTVFSHSPLFSGVTNCFSLLLRVTRSSSSTASTQPVVWQLCRRHSGNRSSTFHRPLFLVSASNRAQFFYLYPRHPLISLHRQFDTHHEHSGGSGGQKKRTGSSSSWDRANRTTATYMAALAVAVVGLSYAAVPLYRIFCQASGYGGTVSVVDPSEKVENMEPLRERELTVR